MVKKIITPLLPFEDPDPFAFNETGVHDPDVITSTAANIARMRLPELPGRASGKPGWADRMPTAEQVRSHISAADVAEQNRINKEGARRVRRILEEQRAEKPKHPVPVVPEPKVLSPEEVEQREVNFAGLRLARAALEQARLARAGTQVSEGQISPQVTEIAPELTKRDDLASA